MPGSRHGIPTRLLRIGKVCRSRPKPSNSGYPARLRRAASRQIAILALIASRRRPATSTQLPVSRPHAATRAGADFLARTAASPSPPPTPNDASMSGATGAAPSAAATPRSVGMHGSPSSPRGACSTPAPRCSLAGLAGDLDADARGEPCQRASGGGPSRSVALVPQVDSRRAHRAGKTIETRRLSSCLVDFSSGNQGQPANGFETN